MISNKDNATYREISSVNGELTILDSTVNYVQVQEDITGLTSLYILVQGDYVSTAGAVSGTVGTQTFTYNTPLSAATTSASDESNWVQAESTTVTVTPPVLNILSKGTGPAVDSTDPLNEGVSTLVAKYQMDGTTGTSVADTTGVYAGTASADLSTLTAPGKFGTALEFNGSSDKITHAGLNLFATNTAFSVSFWVKTSGDLLNIVGAGTAQASSIALGISGGGIYFRNGAANSNEIKISTSGSITDGAWHHLAYSYDGTKSSTGVKLFVDGVEITQKTIVDDNLVTNTAYADLTIGTGVYVASFFTGSLDQVELFSKAISADEVASLYNTGNGEFFTTDTKLLPGTEITLAKDSDNSHEDGIPQSIKIETTSLVSNTDPFGGSSCTSKYELDGNLTATVGTNATGTVTFDTTNKKFGTGSASFNKNIAANLITTNIVLGATSTLSFWVRQTESNGGNWIVDDGLAGDTINNRSDIVQKIRFGATTIFSTATAAERLFPIDGEWHHICITDNGSAIVVYVDNVIQTNASTYTSLNGFEAKLFGGHPTDTINAMVGNIDQIEAYNIALSAEQVSKLYSPIETSYTALIDNFTKTSADFDRAFVAEDTILDVCIESNEKRLINEPRIPVQVEYSITDTSSVDPFGDRSLKAKYELNETTGTVIADSTGNYPGTSAADTSTKTATGTFGNALTFNGSTDIITTNLPTSPTMSFSFWLNLTSNINGDYIIDIYDGAGVGTYISLNGTQVYFQVGSIGVQATVELNTTYHVVCTATAGEMKLYINSTLISTDLTISSIANTVNTMVIGDRNSVSSFNGWIDQVEVYDRALTEKEVKMLYTQGGVINPSKLPATPIMDSINTPSGLVTTSNAAATDICWKAFSRIYNTDASSWHSGIGSVNAWLQYDFGAGDGKIVTKYSVTGYSNPIASPSAWTLRGSNDNFATEDVELHSITGESGWSDSETRYYNISNTTSYQQYRFHGTASNGATDFHVHELELIAANPITLADGSNLVTLTEGIEEGDVLIVDGTECTAGVIQIDDVTNNIISSTNPFGDGSLIYKNLLENDASSTAPLVGASGTATDVTYTAGKFGNAGVFNGSSSYITIPSITINNEHTVSAFIIKDSTDGSTASDGIVQTESNGHGFGYQPSTDSLYINGVTYSLSSFTNSEWIHIVVTYSSATAGILYINGISQGAITALSEAINYLYIGRRSIYYAKVSIDQVEIYNRGLTQSEVQKLYTQQGDAIRNVALTGAPAALPKNVQKKGSKITPSTFVENAEFETVLYEGNDTARTINAKRITTGIDFIWTKARNASADHYIFDSLRPLGEYIVTPTIAASITDVETVTAMGAGSFSLGGDPLVNLADRTYVGWCASLDIAVDYTTENTATLASSTKRNSFMSAFTFTDGGGSGTVNHGLGKVPELTILKARAGANLDWYVYFTMLDGSLDSMLLNTNAGKVDAAQAVPTDTLITTAGFSVDMVGYAFASEPGKCKVGSYTADGVNTVSVDVGFEPAWVMIKSTSAIANWVIIDNSRGNNKWLYPDGVDEEGTVDVVTFNSTGFSALYNFGQVNSATNTYIYLAIAKGSTQNTATKVEITGTEGVLSGTDEIQVWVP